MSTNTFNAKVTTNNQVIIPKEVLKTLGVTDGDRITFVVEGGTMHIVNSAVYAMQIFQKNGRRSKSCWFKF